MIKMLICPIKMLIPDAKFRYRIIKVIKMRKYCGNEHLNTLCLAY